MPKDPMKMVEERKKDLQEVREAIRNGETVKGQKLSCHRPGGQSEARRERFYQCEIDGKSVGILTDKIHTEDLDNQQTMATRVGPTLYGVNNLTAFRDDDPRIEVGCDQIRETEVEGVDKFCLGLRIKEA